MHESPVEVPGKIDRVTGLPWSAAVKAEVATRALAQSLYVVDLHLAGLGTVLDLHGASLYGSLLREITHRASVLLDERDHLSRQAGHRLLLVTGRSPAEVAALVEDVAAGVSAAGVQVDGVRVPRVHVGIAHLPQASEQAEAVMRLDTAILTAELAAAPVPASRLAGGPIGVRPVAGARGKRAVLSSLWLDLSGMVATAYVQLTFGEHRAAARSVGRNAGERRFFLVGEATARAVTDLLPAGYGAVIHEVRSLPPGASNQRGRVLAGVLFLSPYSEQLLFGVAPADGDPPLAAARATLGAVNRRIEPLLGTAPP